MFTKFVASVEVLTPEGTLKYIHERGTEVDWEPAHAHQFIVAGVAQPLDDEASEHYAKFLQKLASPTPPTADADNFVAIADEASAADATAAEGAAAGP
jgi:hypothetical protein